MHIKLEEIIGFVSLLLVVWGINDYSTTKQRKGIAAKLEYLDPMASENRKHELLAKYADGIVDPPNYKYNDEAKRIDKNERKEMRGLLNFSWLLGVVILVVAVLAILGLDFLWQTFIHPFFS